MKGARQRRSPKGGKAGIKNMIGSHKKSNDKSSLIKQMPSTPNSLNNSNTTLGSPSSRPMNSPLSQFSSLMLSSIPIQSKPTQRKHKHSLQQVDGDDEAQGEEDEEGYDDDNHGDGDYSNRGDQEEEEEGESEQNETEEKVEIGMRNTNASVAFAIGKQSLENRRSSLNSSSLSPLILAPGSVLAMASLSPSLTPINDIQTISSHPIAPSITKFVNNNNSSSAAALPNLPPLSPSSPFGLGEKRLSSSNGNARAQLSFSNSAQLHSDLTDIQPLSPFDDDAAPDTPKSKNSDEFQRHSSSKWDLSPNGLAASRRKMRNQLILSEQHASRLTSEEFILLNDVESERNILSTFGENKGNKQIYELKMLPMITSSKDLKDLERIVNFMKSRQHQNILSIEGVFVNPDGKDSSNKHIGVGVATEYCQYPSLKHYIKSHPNLDIDFIISFLSGIAQGMDYLYSNYSDSVLFESLNCKSIQLDSKLIVKLEPDDIENFISSLSTKSDQSSSTSLARMSYYPPEYFKSLSLSIKSDIYAFGCIVYELIASNNPFDGKSVDEIKIIFNENKEVHDSTKIRGDAPRSLVNLMKKCLQIDPDKRPKIKEIVSDIEKMKRHLHEIKEIDNSSIEYRKVDFLFFPEAKHQGTLNEKSYRICKIEKLSNKFLDLAYANELKNIQAMLRSSSPKNKSLGSPSKIRDDISNGNEKLLFFGTSTTNPIKIIANSSIYIKDYSSDGLYGAGYYFSDHARYSNIIKAYNTPGTKKYQLLLCSVICGNSCQFGGIATDKTRKFSSKDLGAEYHSIRAGPHRADNAGEGENDSYIYVVFKETQITPRYLITFESI